MSHESEQLTFLHLLHFHPFLGMVTMGGLRQWAWKAPSQTSHNRYLSSCDDFLQLRHHLHFWQSHPARMTAVIRTWAPV